MNKFRDWELYDELPQGWKIDHTAGSPLTGYLFANDGKSVLRGGRRALVRAVYPQRDMFSVSPVLAKQADPEPQKSKPGEAVITPEAARLVNELARKQFQERMLRDISADLMVCELEGWSKAEYLNELRKLLNGFRMEAAA